MDSSASLPSERRCSWRLPRLRALASLLNRSHRRLRSLRWWLRCSWRMLRPAAWTQRHELSNGAGSVLLLAHAIHSSLNRRLVRLARASSARLPLPPATPKSVASEEVAPSKWQVRMLQRAPWRLQ